MRQIVYVVVKETYTANQPQPTVAVDSVWDVFEHADDRTVELKTDETYARLEAIPMNDETGGRVCNDRLCPECEAPVVAQMMEPSGSWWRSEERPGYKCTSCGFSWQS